MPRFKLVRFDDWEALYDGDDKVIEGHRIDVRDLARVTGIELAIQWVTGPLLAEVEQSGIVPDKFSDYPKEALG